MKAWWTPEAAWLKSRTYDFLPRQESNPNHLTNYSVSHFLIECLWMGNHSSLTALCVAGICRSRAVPSLQPRCSYCCFLLRHTVYPQVSWRKVVGSTYFCKILNGIWLLIADRILLPRYFRKLRQWLCHWTLSDILTTDYFILLSCRNELSLLLATSSFYI